MAKIIFDDGRVIETKRARRRPRTLTFNELKQKRESLENKYSEKPKYSVQILKGSVKCVACSAKMTGPICLNSGCVSTKCFIEIYWKGEKHRFFRYKQDGETFDYQRASMQLAEMNIAIKNKKFNPNDWTEQAINKHAFPHQVERWLAMKAEEMEANELAPETLRVYKSYAKNYFLPFFSKYDVKEIGFEQLEAFKDSLRKIRGIKTRRNILNGLHAFFNWMRRKGIVKELPTWPEITGDNSKVRGTIDYETQLKALQNVPEAHRDPIEMGIETGLRPGETTALKIGDIDFANRQALIQRTFSGSILRETTKGKNKRWIPLSDRAFEIVVKNSRDKLPSAFVFINPKTGRHYIPEYLNLIWRKYSGVEMDYYSASRHSFCTQIVESGANIFDAKDLMRHTDIRTTQRYYHASGKRLREIVNNRGRVAFTARLLPEGKVG